MCWCWMHNVSSSVDFAITTKGENMWPDKLDYNENVEKPGNEQNSTEATLLCKKPEFIKRYVEGLKPLGLSVEMATASAEASFEQWDGIDTPEECAEDEMQAWAADA